MSETHRSIDITFRYYALQCHYHMIPIIFFIPYKVYLRQKSKLWWYNALFSTLCNIARRYTTPILTLNIGHRISSCCLSLVLLFVFSIDFVGVSYVRFLKLTYRRPSLVSFALLQKTRLSRAHPTLGFANAGPGLDMTQFLKCHTLFTPIILHFALGFP